MASLAPRIDNLESYRNISINGNFDFWQRGFAPAVSVNNVKFLLADRWRVQNTATSNVTVERDTSVPTFAQSGFQSQYSMKLTNSVSPTSPLTNYVLIRYLMEGYDYAELHGRPFRIYIWVKSSIAGVYGISLGNASGTRTYVSSITINAANTWEKKFIDVVGDIAGTWLFDNGEGLRIIVNLQVPASAKTGTLNTWQTDANVFFAPTNQVDWAATASSTFSMCQFMIVPGLFTPETDHVFKRAGRTIQQELAMCQRYYEKSYDLDVVPGSVSTNGLSVGNVFVTHTNLNTTSLSQSFAVRKRISNPAMTFYRYTAPVAPGFWNYYDQGSTGASGAALGVIGSSGFSVYLPTYSSTANRGLEISGHWTAEAEL